MGDKYSDTPKTTRRYTQTLTTDTGITLMKEIQSCICSEYLDKEVADLLEGKMGFSQRPFGGRRFCLEPGFCTAFICY
jgi:hypothetical protein